jgi:hypothetical protein
MADSIAVTEPELLVFVDETGGESLKDPANPVFGLAGCAMRADSYFGIVAPAWRELKAKHCGGEDVPLHASEFSPSDSDAVIALSDFFRTQHFSRFGVTITTATDCAGLEPFRLVSSALLEQFRKTARYWSGIVRIRFILEQSDRGDALAQRYLSGWKYWREAEGSRTEIPIERHLMAKKAGAPGLEIADFIAHTLGGQSRAFLAGRRTPRKDFCAMIVEVDQRLVSVIDIHAVQRGDGGDE